MPRSGAECQSAGSRHQGSNPAGSPAEKRSSVPFLGTERLLVHRMADQDDGVRAEPDPFHCHIALDRAPRNDPIDAGPEYPQRQSYGRFGQPEHQGQMRGRKAQHRKKSGYGYRVTLSQVTTTSYDRLSLLASAAWATKLGSR